MQRSSFLYQPYFCEENIWHLCQAPQLVALPRYVTFISNPDKNCAIWHQKAATSPKKPVIWDYHVVLLVMIEKQWHVLDFDTTLRFQTPLASYLDNSFPSNNVLPQSCAPLFRLIEPSDFLKHFSSNRSHMQSNDGVWDTPPPPWSLCQSEANAMNLMDFTSISFKKEDFFVGEIMDLKNLRTNFLNP